MVEPIHTTVRAERHRDAVVVVTGAASGIGRACAKRIVAEGGRVVVADIDERAATVVASELGGTSVAVSCAVDVREGGSCDELGERALESFGRVTGLVNAAGVNQPRCSIVDFTDAEWHRVLDINLTGTLATIRSLAPHLGPGSSIVTVASGAGRIARPGAAAYCVSKAGVLMLTKVAALELGPSGVRVNAIAPGFIDTPLNRAKLAGDDRARYERAAALRRIGTADDVASVASFLLSAESSFITGDLIAVDGGVAAPSRP